MFFLWRLCQSREQIKHIKQEREEQRTPQQLSGSTKLLFDILNRGRQWAWAATVDTGDKQLFFTPEKLTLSSSQLDRK